MTNYLLIHGGDRDGSIWNKVATFLKSQGHSVLCPTMKSVKEASLYENIEEILNVVRANKLENIILVAHSYGAMVATGVLDKIPDKIKTLVYIDSVVPKDGYSLYEILAQGGIDYKDFGLTPDGACAEKLYFNQEYLSNKTKVYILCLKSEFTAITKQVYDELLSDNNWLTFCLDTSHACMVTQPEQLAVVLSGVQILDSDNNVKD
jgi:pimeloyl-ACP methyl ester carboxylesterase